MEDTEKLKIIGELGHETFDRILTEAVSKILDRKDEELDLDTPLDTEDLKDGAYKAGFAAVCTMILEVIKVGGDRGRMYEILEESDVGISKARIDKFFDVIEKERHELEIRASSCSQAICFDQVVDVQWRMDYQIASSVSGKLNEPIYYVTLKTVDQNNNPGEDTSFQCSLQQLEDLVQRLQDAEKQVERVISRE